MTYTHAGSQQAVSCGLTSALCICIWHEDTRPSVWSDRSLLALVLLRSTRGVKSPYIKQRFAKEAGRIAAVLTFCLAFSRTRSYKLISSAMSRSWTTLHGSLELRLPACHTGRGRREDKQWSGKDGEGKDRRGMMERLTGVETVGREAERETGSVKTITWSQSNGFSLKSNWTKDKKGE